MTALWIAIGGAIGSSLRYALMQLLPYRDFPYAVLLVNVAGCLLIGVLRGVPAEKLLLSPAMRDVLAIGLLGGFTTFSAFAFDTVELFAQGNRWYALANVLAQLLLCLAACGIGYSMVARAV